MIPHLYQLEITLHEATFFASHELGAFYFTEPLIGNYAMVYALGLAKSPYDRYHVGYAEDLPQLNLDGIYVTPAWSNTKPSYRIEQFNCQAESFVSAMTNNAVAELAGRQYLKKEGKALIEGGSGKKINPTNRPQIGTLKLLCPYNQFCCHVISREKISFPRYVRLGKFMSKAKIIFHKIELNQQKHLLSKYQLINPIDLHPETKIHFGDTVNIHPTPLVRKAEIEGNWWIDPSGRPLLPAGMEYRGY